MRAVIGVLILLNMTLIYLLSAQNGSDSEKTSGKVTETVAEIVVPDFHEKPEPEKQEIIQQIHPPVRKLAHMAEFGSLGALIFLFLLTWNGAILPRYLGSLAATFLYACTDELHQIFSDARGPQISDVLIDLLGALICCSILLAIVMLVKKKGRGLRSMQVTRYDLKNEKLPRAMRIALVSDLHGERRKGLIERITAENPDLILIPGDLMEDKQLSDETSVGYEVLRACAGLAPTFYSLGNHEIGCYHSGNPWVHPKPVPLSAEIKSKIAKTGAVLLDNEIVRVNGLCICGLTSGINGKKNEPDRSLIEKFEKSEGFHILLCHHPEYFVPFIEKTNIELTVCGHAHGGQWRVFGHGIYAPGQGLFPKYTAGVLQERCVISRGLGNHTHIPRFFNRRELVIIDYSPEVSDHSEKTR